MGFSSLSLSGSGSESESVDLNSFHIKRARQFDCDNDTDSDSDFDLIFQWRQLVPIGKTARPGVSSGTALFQKGLFPGALVMGGSGKSWEGADS